MCSKVNENCLSTVLYRKHLVHMSSLKPTSYVDRSYGRIVTTTFCYNNS